MDRSKVTNFKKANKKIVISHTQNEVSKQKNFTGTRQEGIKTFFSRLFLCLNFETLEVPSWAVFSALI